MVCVNGHQMVEGGRFCTQCGGSPAALTQPAMSGGYSAPAATSYGYPTGPAGMAYVPNLPTSGFAIAGLILAIIGVPLLSIIFGFVALSQIKAGKSKGRGMALAAVIIGFLWMAFAILLIVLSAASSQSTY